MARDPIETRGFATVTPDDLNDPPRFAQMRETATDAIVLALREFFQRPTITVARKAEAPTIKKYSITTPPTADPYATFIRLSQEYPDLAERLPHIAITGTSGDHLPLNVGRPMLATTQQPPRVTTSSAPFALANPVRQVSTIAVNTVGAGAYTVILNGVAFTYTAGGGDTAATILDGLRLLINDGCMGVVGASLNAAGTLLSLRAANLGTVGAFTISVSSNLTAATPTAASGASTPSVLAYRTIPSGRVGGEAVESQVVFHPVRFTTTPSAATAADLARVFNEQALYAHAVVRGNVVDILTGGIGGGNETPNEIEILPCSAASALGLCNQGVGIAGNTITAGSAFGQFVLTIGSAPFSTSMVGRYLTLDSCISSANEGRFRIVAATTSTLTYENADGVAESFNNGTWFVGLRDDWTNVARPVCHRFVLCWRATASMNVYTEGPNERLELIDLVCGQFSFFLEEQFFTFLGRSVQDESFTQENYKVVVKSEVRHSGDSDFARPNSQKGKVFEARIEVPMTVWWHIDRPVLIPGGSTQWTLQGIDLDDTLEPRT